MKIWKIWKKNYKMLFFQQHKSI